MDGEEPTTKKERTAWDEFHEAFKQAEADGTLHQKLGRPEKKHWYDIGKQNWLDYVGVRNPTPEQHWQAALNAIDYWTRDAKRSIRGCLIGGVVFLLVVSCLLIWFIQTHIEQTKSFLILVAAIISVIFLIVAMAVTIAQDDEEKKRQQEAQQQPIDDTSTPINPTTGAPEPESGSSITKIARLQDEAHAAINRARARIYADQNEPWFDQERAQQQLQRETEQIMLRMNMEIMKVTRGDY